MPIKKGSFGTIKVIHVEPYDFQILVVVGYSYDELKAELKKQKCDEWMMGISEDKELIDNAAYLASRRQFKIKGREYVFYYIFIRDGFTFSDDEMCTLAHECYHICQYSMHRYLNPMVEEEAVAYIHTSIMKKALACMRESQKYVREHKPRRKKASSKKKSKK